MKAINWLHEKALDCNDTAIKCKELGLDYLAKDFSELDDKISDIIRFNLVWNDEVEDE